MAHDFNNLLTVIAGRVEFILDDTGLPPQVLEDGLAIQKATEQATSLTRQLLAFSRKQVLQPKRLILNTIVRDLETMLARLIGSHIEIRTRLAPNLAFVLADASQLEQVGHIVAVAADPEIALGLVGRAEQRFDLIISDVVMPKMNGLEMAARLTDAQPGLKILIMSGYTDAALVQHGVLSADLSFLSKPFSKAQLHAKIVEAMGA